MLPVKWMPASSARLEGDPADHHRIAGHEVDDARRQAGRFEQLQRVVGAQHRAGRRLPHHGVAHQRRRRRQVAADGREVERRHGVDEALETAVVGLVPHRRRRHRLLGHQLGGEGHVVAPEVDELARRVDLGLVDGLRLPEHRRGVQGVAPGGGEQIGGLEEHRRPVFPGPARPLGARAAGRGDRRRHVLGPGVVEVGQHVAVVVRHHRVAEAAGAHLLAADDQRDLRPARRPSTPAAP